MVTQSTLYHVEHKIHCIRYDTRYTACFSIKCNIDINGVYLQLGIVSLSWNDTVLNVFVNSVTFLGMLTAWLLCAVTILTPIFSDVAQHVIPCKVIGWLAITRNTILNQY